MSLPKIIPEVFQEHEEKVKRFQELAKHGEGDIKELAQVYLETLSSPSGNDILEKLLVRATGREPKSNDKKHGADSEDGLVEAKPCKEKYSGHISDDTGMSLQRHQNIPYCILGVTTKDGTSVKWAVSCSYRIFDNSRYKEIVKTLGLTGESWPSDLPTDKTGLLQKLVEAHKPKHYVRSCPLPLSCLKTVPISELDIWVHPSLLSKTTSYTSEEKIIVDLLIAKEESL
jgi:hypothetical protein